MPPRVYSPESISDGSRIRLNEDAANHVRRVLRLSAGDELLVFDGSGRDFPAMIEQADRRGVLLRVGQGRQSSCESSLDITLLQGLARGPRMDLVIQKATELGVRRIQTLAMERSVVRLGDDRTGNRLRHWQRVATSACEQCGRAVPPEVLAPVSLAAAMDRLPAEGVRLLLDPAGESGLTELLAGSSTVALLVGPEGGLAPGERAAALRLGFRPLRLGPRILRTETAPLVALSLIQYLAGDLAQS